MRALWGVDSAVKVDEKLYNCVTSKYGKPKFWGRYLTRKEGVNDGLSKEELLFLHIRGIRIIPIYNDFSSAVGYRSGQVAARNAIFHASRLKFPKDTVVFANIENFFEVNDSWISAWVDVFFESGYLPGFYHDPLKGDFNKAYCAAVKNNARVKKYSILWSAEPREEASNEIDAPLFQPKKPSCVANVLGWQYGREAQGCPIETNLILFKLYQLLW
ncbi:glycoside hydrolase domain-containing protein [Lottiidibacillus patelloidae]|uniref:glycoside hydrolase domain-containing protein n=1 Tax=Lottiidibacillus patelloidae TaxID=2670334 RepID=UPI001E3AE778|nr:glycoside hydrolase domain-containing protein [Lottiidibacillus patelloidae]